MKPTNIFFLLIFALCCVNAASAQYGGYNSGYGGGYGGYGRGGGMGMDRSMMAGPQSTPSKPKEIPAEETAAKIVEQMRPELKLDDLQAIAITNALADSIREQGVLLKNESSSQDQKIEQINALRESTTKKVNAFLSPEQIEKYKEFMATFKGVQKEKSKKKKDSKDHKEATEEEKTKKAEE